MSHPYQRAGSLLPGDRQMAGKPSKTQCVSPEALNDLVHRGHFTVWEFREYSLVREMSPHLQGPVIVRMTLRMKMGEMSELLWSQLQGDMPSPQNHARPSLGGFSPIIPGSRRSGLLPAIGHDTDWCRNAFRYLVQDQIAESKMMFIDFNQEFLQKSTSERWHISLEKMQCNGSCRPTTLLSAKCHL